MLAPVTGHERDRVPPNRADAQRRRSAAIRRLDLDVAGVVEKLVETGAAEDSDSDIVWAVGRLIRGGPGLAGLGLFG